MPEECMIKRKTIFFRTLPGAGFALLAVALFFFDGWAMAGTHSLILTMPPILAARSTPGLPPHCTVFPLLILVYKDKKWT